MVSYDRVLPIGTVVMLQGATQKLMILGYQRMSADENDKMIYDYCGCPFPEGYISPEKTAIFNHDRIERVYYIGLQNDEEKMFEEKLTAVIREREEANA